MSLWPRRSDTPRPAAAPPAVLVVRHIRKAIGAPGVTAGAVGVAVGIVLGLVLAAALLTLTRDDS